MTSRLGLALLGAALCIALLAAPASGQARFLKALWGPEMLPAGDAACPTKTEPCSAFPTYRELGVDIFQFQIHWDEIAPTRPKNPRNPKDPAYHWETIDPVVEEAREYGIRLAALVQRAPHWANGGRPTIWAPTDPKTFADFLFAASKKYPSIGRWMIWGEPSRAENFRPMSAAQPRGARLYAELLDRAFGALRQANPHNIVIGGMTLNGGTVMPPQFIEWMKLKNGRPPRMDLWGHNPFDARYPRLHDEPLGRYRGFNDLDTLYEEIKTAYEAGHRKVPRLWLSEWTIVSEKPLNLFSGFFVSRREQAVRLKAAYQIASQTSYVAGLGWFTLLDQADSEGGAKWGLMQADGRPKPAFNAYKSLP